MATLFEQSELKGMKLRNRMVRSATWEGMCGPDGRPTAKLMEYYRNLARGGVGLITSGFAFVRPEGKALPGKMGIHTDEFAEDYRNLVAAVHEEGGSLVIQIVHAGGQTDSKNAGRQPLAPSSVKVEQFPETPAELTKNEIREIIEAFGQAARRAKEWGADGVQIHGAHGYLVNQFLSPLTNRRSDAYGGDIHNRCRFMLEVFEAVRHRVGPDYPVTIKLSASDNQEGGLSAADGLHAAGLLSQTGIDAIEVSAGTPGSGEQGAARLKIDSPAKEAYNLELAAAIRQKVACPIVVVGGFRSYDVAQQALSDEKADSISLCRPLIREPDLPSRWLNGDRSPATCISCNGCFMPGLKQGGIYCVQEKRTGGDASRPPG